MNRERTAGELLGVGGDRAVAAVVGCGGKTAFIESLARQWAEKKVLISPTTKILPMTAPDVTLCDTLEQCAAHRARRGIQCLGVKNGQTGKLEALPQALLEALLPPYDLALLEADGSAGLSCKGWGEYEPVVPHFCTHTVGVVALSALGRPVDDSTVHRMAEFTRLTGLRRGDAVTIGALADMICGARGMFKNAVGRRLLFINQAEDAHRVRQAKALTALVKGRSPTAFARIAWGSARANQWREG